MENRPGSEEPLLGKCGAQLRKFNDPEDERYHRYCIRPAGWGTPHPGIGTCKLHGGSTPQAIRKAGRVMAEKEATRLGKMLGEERKMEDPAVELWRLAETAIKWMEICETLVGEMEEYEPTLDRQGIEHSRALIEQWQTAAISCRDTLLSIAKLDISKRLLKIRQDQADLLMEIINASLTAPELGLEDEVIAAFRRTFRDKFEPVSGCLELHWLPDTESVEEVEAELLEKN